MMIRILLLATAVLIILHEANCRPQATTQELSPVQQAIQNINPELDKITQSLKELKLEINKSLIRTLTETHEAISNFGRSLFEALNNLESVSDKITVSNENNMEIAQCINIQQAQTEKILKTIYSKTIKYSDNSKLQIGNFTEKLDVVVKEADDIETNINKIIGFCIRQNNLQWQKDKLKKCLSNEVKLLNEVVDHLYHLANLDCIGGNVNMTRDQRGILKWINTVQAEFLTCISSSKEMQMTSADTSSENVTSSKILEIIRNQTLVETTSQTPISSNDETQENSTKELKKVKLSSQFQPSGLNQTKLSTTLEAPKQANLFQRIVGRIERLEGLVERLKQVHESLGQDPLKDVPNLKDPSSGKLSNEEAEAPRNSKKFIIYISF